ncbi:MAG: hypothetical protein GEV08_20275 [Acidimicrobiia bacterium]|nr:hypothetical protein [Acidimicrobiia bacterium]
MTLHQAFTIALIAVSASLVLLVLVTAARRVANGRSAERRARLEAEARPVLLAAIHEPGERSLEGLSRAQRHTLERLAAGLLGKLRGEDRAALVEVLEAHGVLAEAVRHTRSRWALRRARAAELLGAAGWSPALWDLARLCTDRRAEVRLVAARALAKLGDPVAVPVLLATLEPPARLPVGTVAMALARITEGAAPRLRVALASSAPQARAIAADLLGLHGAVVAVDELGVVLRDDPEAPVRAACARALGRIGSPRCVAPLLDAAGADPADAVRAEAVGALGLAGSPRAVPVLARALEEGTAEVSERAAAALAVLGPKARSVLRLRRAVPGPAGERAGAALARAELADDGRRRRAPAARRAA